MRTVAALHDAGVVFVVIGSYGRVLRGASADCADVDVVVDATPANLGRLGRALSTLGGTVLGVQGRRIPVAEVALERADHWTVTTSLGTVDVVLRFSDGRTYFDALDGHTMVDVDRRSVRVGP